SPGELEAEAAALVDVRVLGGGPGRVLLGAAGRAEAGEPAAGRLHPGEVPGRDGQVELPDLGGHENVGHRIGAGRRSTGTNQDTGRQSGELSAHGLSRWGGIVA